MLSRLTAGVLCAFLVFAPDVEAGEIQAANPAKARVFLDCSRCDEDYLRKEITFIDYVRNREDADVHVLVTTQDTGGGGRQWTVKFIGLGAYQGVEQTLIYNQPQSGDARRDACRLRRSVQARGWCDTLEHGARRSAARHLQGAEGQAIGTSSSRIRGTTGSSAINAGGDVNGEELSSGRAFRGSFSANRTTDDWRMSFRAARTIATAKFLSRTRTAARDDSQRVRDMNLNGLVVKSLTQHWSLGLVGSVNSQTFRNFDVRTRIARASSTTSSRIRIDAADADVQYTVGTTTTATARSRSTTSSRSS
jgi:hypothetical protein